MIVSFQSDDPIHKQLDTLAGVTLLAARLAEGVAGIEYDDDRPDLSEYDIAFTADVGVQEGGR
ncbi:hypothetical protein QSV00_09935 [Bifidobacterium longum]|uniref:hypothetical protein n=1 Tax=Bifidobacterium longum TaxID=216816 RepID=UPI0025703415|nr:hypothetical protein [Bifidobacterium longum]MDL5506104.1 hypothetical protein [Bifidobacterium longum]